MILKRHTPQCQKRSGVKLARLFQCTVNRSSIPDLSQASYINVNILQKICSLFSMVAPSKEAQRYKDYVCSICQAKFKYDRNLRQHKIKFHPEDARSAEQTYQQDAVKSNASEYLCFKCSRIFTNNSDFLRYLNSEHGDGTLLFRKNLYVKAQPTISSQDCPLKGRRVSW